MRLLLLTLLASLAAACNDPCSAPTTGLTLHPLTLQQLNVGASSLGCAGTVDGKDLNCLGDTSVESAVCDDGFGIVLSQGNMTVLIHLANADGWHAGAMLSDGTAATGDLSIAGLGAAPQPTTNATVAGSFDVRADKSKLNGLFTFIWP